MSHHIHVIDPDTRRRAAVSRLALELGFHAEIYEDFLEFEERKSAFGLIFAAQTEAPVILGALKDGHVELPVVIYAENPNTREIVEAVKAGAADFLDWPAGGEKLTRVVERACESGKEMMALLRKRAAATSLVKTLSSRETDVLMGILTGGSNKSIAAELSISPRTVEIHRGNMMRKLNARATGDAVRIALYGGLDSEMGLAA